MLEAVGKLWVAWLLLSASAGGERRSSSVTTCDDESCFLDHAPVPLTEAPCIGFGVGEEAPP